MSQEQAGWGHGSITNVQYDLTLTSKLGSTGSPSVPSGNWDIPFFSGYSQVQMGKTPEQIKLSKISSLEGDAVGTGQMG